MKKNFKIFGLLFILMVLSNASSPFQTVIERPPLLDTSGKTTLISVANDSTQGNSYSDAPSISDNGRYVAFHSNADNLVAGDTNNSVDVFLFDNQTGIIKRVSVSSDGTQGNSNSEYPSISGDGRYIIYRSGASNLIAGDSNGYDDIFVHDSLNEITTRVSVASDGSQSNNRSYVGDISADGRYVAFISDASNLVSGDTNGATDVFRHDIQNGTTIRVSVASDGSQATYHSSIPTISSNGRFIAYESDASNLVIGDTNTWTDIFYFDAQTGNTKRISVASDGTQGNNYSQLPSISGEGRYVTFSSMSSNLVSGDTNSAQDIFLHDTLLGETILISRSSGGVIGNAYSGSSSISSNGQYIAYSSHATNLVPGDINGVGDVFLFDVQTEQTQRVSISSNYTESNGYSGIEDEKSISSNGNYIVFPSNASNLVSGDTNGEKDVFLREIIVQPDVAMTEIIYGATDNGGNPLPPSQVFVIACARNIGSVAIQGTISMYEGELLLDTLPFPPTGVPLPVSFQGCAEFTWDLGSSSGRKENINLTFVANLIGETDVNPADNTHTETINLYWADFPVTRDGYSFDNAGYTRSMFLSDLMDLAANPTELALLGPYALSVHLFEEGHCAGMAATSILYREYPGMRPTGYIQTYDIPSGDAWPMIRKYQRNQFLVYSHNYPSQYSESIEFNKLIAFMDQPTPSPMLLSLRKSGGDGGHAVVVHKVLDTGNKDYVFIYDNNYHSENRQGEIYASQFLYGSYDRFYPREVNQLSDDWVKTKALELARKYLMKNDWISLFVGSPVEVIVTNSSGDRIGTLSSTEINEIPGAEMWWIDGKYYFTLPNTDTYTVTATGDLSTAVGGPDGASSSTMDLGYASPTPDGQIMAVSFTDVPITDASPHITVIGDDPDNVDPIHLPGGGTHPADEIEVTNPETFPDVQSTHWAWNYVEGIYEAGLTSGYPDGTYLPENPVNRAEMAIFLQKGMGGASFTPPAIDGSHPFSDISGHWAESWIEELFDSGMTGGYPDGTYRPFNKVTRAEMAIFLLKARHGNSYSPPAASGGAFSDVEGHWAEAWIEQLAAEGITSGYPDGTFRPDRTVTRAEMAVFLVNAFGLPTL